MLRLSPYLGGGCERPAMTTVSQVEYMLMEQLEAEALKLSSTERALLAERLILSLDEDSEVELAWVKLADDRFQKVNSGEMGTTSADVAIANMRASLVG